jgi:hypothetical protein
VKFINTAYKGRIDAGWSSLVARRAHNPKVVGSNPAPATNPDIKANLLKDWLFLFNIKSLIQNSGVTPK